MPTTLAICFICIIFPFQGILQDYTEFDIRTITTLKKLLVVDFSILLSIT
jgi:hypothetical protein